MTSLKYYLQNKALIRSKERQRYHDVKSKVEYRFKHYKRSAKVRGFEFMLTFEQFKTFWQLPCTYCGNEIPSIGLDRVDNSLGYLITNVVPCCLICNRMKLTLSKEAFLEHIARIHNYCESKETVG